MSILNHSNPPARRQSRNDRDMGDQLAGIASVLSRHRSKLDAAWADSISDDERSAGARAGMCRVLDADELAEALDRARGEKDIVLIKALNKATKLGPLRSVAGAPTAAALFKLREDFPTFSDVVALVERRRALASVTPGREFHLPPVLLSGPPGVGKTAFVERLAACFSVPFRRVDIASATAGFALAGSHKSWSGAQPGAVWSVLQSPCASGIILLDEIDKSADSKYAVLGSLYTLLERLSARHFRDECIDIEVDASNLMWIATCNEPQHLEAALRSRFTEFEISQPTQGQMTAIVRSVYTGLRAHTRWAAAFDEELPDDVLEALGELNPRLVIRVLEDGHARAAADGRRRLWLRDIILPERKHQQRMGFVKGDSK